MNRKKIIKKIILTGPESTGKTTLCEQLSDHYNTIYIPEYARTYIENLNRNYTYNDVVEIAKHQIKTLKKNKHIGSCNYIFFDTGLIVTKIWFSEVFGKVPDFIETAVKTINVDLYLLCSPDIDWIPDKIRKNKGEKRIDLYYKYKSELEKNKFNYFIIKGEANTRFLNAKEYIDSAYCL